MYRALLVVAVLVVSYFAFAPKPIPLLTAWDKVKHAVTFLVLAWLTDFSFPRSRFGASKVTSLVAYGVFIEVVQYFIPNRSTEVLDVMADAVGIACYVMLIPALQRLPWLHRRWNEPV